MRRWNRNGRAVLRLTLRFLRAEGAPWSYRATYAVRFVAGGRLP